jgi:hypothetical protein
LQFLRKIFSLLASRRYYHTILTENYSSSTIDNKNSA